VSRPHVIDPARPMLSLREHAGLTQAAVAKARGITQQAVRDAEQAGGWVSVEKLRETCEALGMTLEIRVK